MGGYHMGPYHMGAVTLSLEGGVGLSCLLLYYWAALLLYYWAQGSVCKVKTQYPENFDEEVKSLVTAWRLIPYGVLSNGLYFANICF